MEIKVKENTVLIDDDIFNAIKTLGFSLYMKGEYVAVGLNGLRYKDRTFIHLHALVINPLYRQEIDHINRNKLDNRRCNLREVSKAQNGKNRPGSKNSTSPFKGVSFVNKIKGKPWISSLGFNGKTIHYEYHKCEVAAAVRYNEKHIEVGGEFSNPNKIPEDHVCGERCSTGPSIPYS